MDKINTTVFDIDDTLTTSNSWERLNVAAGVTADEDYELYSGFMRGDFDYESWIQQLENLYRERNILTRELAEETLLNFTLREYVVNTILELKSNGYTIVLLSGGFRTMAEAMGKLVHADKVFALSDIVYNDNNRFDHFLSHGEEGHAKLQTLEGYCTQAGILLTDCITIGDSMNDVPLFDVTTNGVTFSWCKDAVKAKAKTVINDIRDLIPLLQTK